MTKEKKDDLAQIYVKHGIRAIRPLCLELGISPQSIANYAHSIGLYRRTRRTSDYSDPRWARAKAIGVVVA